MVRSKFRVYSKTELEGSKEYPSRVVVNLVAVQGEPFGKYTPSASLEMCIQNDEAQSEFVVGKEYFVDFTSVQ